MPIQHCLLITMTIFVPSVSASFIFSELMHMENMNFGKLRASYASYQWRMSLPYRTDVYYSLGKSV